MSKKKECLATEAAIVLKDFFGTVIIITLVGIYATAPIFVYNLNKDVIELQIENKNLRQRMFDLKESTLNEITNFNHRLDALKFCVLNPKDKSCK